MAVIKQFLNSNGAYFWEMLHLWEAQSRGKVIHELFE
jgi:predicted phage gp36 major capsid-like protein